MLGFGLSMIQVLPFIHYIPFSPRAGIQGYEWSTTYATPWIHVPEFFISGFTGQNPLGTYWGPNHIKLHSEYLGLPVIALAALGVGGPRKRLVRWILGIAVLFFLIALGDGSPFYRLWWAVVPYVDKTRAPGIAFYIVGFAASVLAAFGTERLQRGEGARWARISLVAGLVVVLLAFLGVFGVMAGAYTQGTPQAAIAERATSGIMWGAVGSGIGLAVTAAIVLLFQRGALAMRAFSLLLALVIGADLWRAGSGFWHWSRPETEQIASDDIIRRVKQTPLPYRVYDAGHVYAADALMAHDIPQVTGYHGNHLQTYLDLIGGEDEQVNLLRSLNLWKLLAVRYLIVGTDSIHVPGFHKTLGPDANGAWTDGVPVRGGHRSHVCARRSRCGDSRHESNRADTARPAARLQSRRAILAGSTGEATSGHRAAGAFFVACDRHCVGAREDNNFSRSGADRAELSPCERKLV